MTLCSHETKLLRTNSFITILPVCVCVCVCVCVLLSVCRKQGIIRTFTPTETHVHKNSVSFNFSSKYHVEHVELCLRKIKAGPAP